MTNNTKNILIIGKTGSGKSTLANVISGTNKFKESEGSVSETKENNSENKIKEIQTQETEIDGIKYRVIDMISIVKTGNNIQLSKKKEINSVKAINQILFAISSSRLTKEDLADLKLLETIFDEDIANYTTIIRTKFTNFEDEDKCEEDIKEITKISNSFASCKVIHIDNPSISISGKNAEIKNSLNKEIREVSRTKLLNYLKENCKENYELDNTKITNYIEEIERKLAESESSNNNSAIETNPQEQTGNEEKKTWLQNQIEYIKCHCSIN